MIKPPVPIITKFNGSQFDIQPAKPRYDVSLQMKRIGRNVGWFKCSIE